MLNDEHPKVRFAAADAIGKTFLLSPSQRQNGRTIAGEGLYRALQSEAEVGVQEVLITALGAVKYEPALPALHSALESSRESIRRAAHWALGRFQDEGDSIDSARIREPNPSTEQRSASTIKKTPNLIEEAVQALRSNPDFISDIIKTAQEPLVTFRIMQDTIQSLQATPNIYDDAVRAAQETPIFVEATIRAMEAVPSFVQEAVRAADEIPSSFRAVEDMVEAIAINPAFVEEAIRAARRAPDALQATERAIRRAGGTLALQDSIRMMAQVQDKVVHGDTLTEGLAHLSQSIADAGQNVASANEPRASEIKAAAFQAVLTFLVLYLILTSAARSWGRRMGMHVSDLEIFLAALLVWQRSTSRPQRR
jgi:hypothetical protein